MAGKHMTLAQRIGANLRFVREERGLTAKQVAALLTIDANALTRYETGRRGCPVDVLDRLADFFGRPIGWFTGELNDAEVIRLTAGIQPVLGAQIRQLPEDHQRALADLLPGLFQFAGRTHIEMVG